MTPRRPGFGMTSALVSMVLLTAVLVAQQKPATQKTPPVSAATSPDALLGQALHEEEVEGRLQNAIAIYQKVLKAPGVTRAQAGRAQFRIGACYERLGLVEARKAYEAVVANYADQADLAAQAKARLAALAEPAVRGSGPAVRQIWATSEHVGQGRLSPDGRYVVGVDGETGDLVIRSLATGQVRRLTALSKDRWWQEYARLPIWSRDGRQIAYAWVTPGRTEFRIADVAGETTRVVPMDARFQMYSAEDWSPDGRRVLVRVADAVPQNRRHHLAWVTITGGTVHLLASADAGKDLGRAFLTPSGAWVVTRIPGDDAAFSILAAGGGPPQTLTPAAASDALIGWSADGTHVLFVSREGGTNDLMAVRVADGRAVDRPFLIRTLQEFAALGVSPAGALLYQSTPPARYNVYRASFDVTSGRVGQPSRVDISTGHSSGCVSWSADGRRLAYLTWPERKRARTLSIWSAEAGQTRSFNLPVDAGPPTTSWSADGRWVYFVGTDDAWRQGLHRLDTETGTVEAVAASLVDLSASKPISWIFGWSPDARLVYKAEWTFKVLGSLWDGAIAAIVEHRLADHAERELFRSSPPHQSKADGLGVSSDGRQLAFTMIDYFAGKLTVMVMPAAGGPAKAVAEVPARVHPQDGAVVRWTPDGRAVVVSSFGAPKVRLMCDVTTGAVTPLSLPVDVVAQIVVSPDGKEIAYIGGNNPDQGVWMLENFLPKPKAPAPAPKK